MEIRYLFQFEKKVYLLAWRELYRHDSYVVVRDSVIGDKRQKVEVTQNKQIKIDHDHLLYT